MQPPVWRLFLLSAFLETRVLFFASVSASQDHWFLWSKLQKQIDWKYSPIIILHIPSLSLSQLTYFKTVCQGRNVGTLSHTSVHGTPLRISVTFLFHSQAWSHLVVIKFHGLVLSLYYDQMFVLSMQLGDSVYTVGAGLPPVCTSTSRHFGFWYCLKGVWVS